MKMLFRRRLFALARRKVAISNHQYTCTLLYSRKSLPQSHALQFEKSRSPVPARRRRVSSVEEEKKKKKKKAVKQYLKLRLN